MSDENQPDFQPDLRPPDPGWVKIGVMDDHMWKATPILSILLCTVENRAELFAKLHAEVMRQAEGRSVEVLVACDAKQISIGKKRQNLLEQATGEYVAYIDDDDWIAPTYVDDILAALTKDPDCVGFKIECTMNGGRPEMAAASKRYSQWGDNRDGYRYVRTPYHKTPCRRSIALKVGFPDLRYCEDKPFSEGITRLIETEVFVDRVLYYYRFKNEPFGVKFGFPTGPNGRPIPKGMNTSHVRRPFQH